MSISRNSIGAGSWPESPWHGCSLGDWSDELDEEAALAVSGDYLPDWDQTGYPAHLE